MNLDGQNRLGIRATKGEKMSREELNKDAANGANSAIVEREDLDQKLKKMDERLKQMENALSK